MVLDIDISYCFCLISMPRSGLGPVLLNRKDTVNTLRPRQDGRRFPDDIFKHIFLIENVEISLKISLKFIP